MLKILFKESTDTKKLNKELNKLNLNHIVDEDFLNEWVDGINNDPKELERYKNMFGFDEANVENLKKAYKFYTVMFSLDVDFYFGRISQEEATMYGDFILKHKKDIEYIEDGVEFANRFDFSNEVKKTILELDKPWEEPEKLPIEEQHIPDLQSGVVLVKSWGIDPFWIMYGKVESPRFLKKKIYKNDIYNTLYRDDKGFGYLLVPLAPMGASFGEFVKLIYKDAYDMGLRESFPFFATMVYGADFDMSDLEEYFETSYTGEELFEKHNTMSEYFKHESLEWNEKTKRYNDINIRAENSKLTYFSALERVIRADDELYKKLKSLL